MRFPLTSEGPRSPMTISTLLHATGDDAATGGIDSNLLLNIGLFALLAIVIIFMFRNSRKRRADAEELQTKMVPGAEIMTQTGIFGTLDLDRRRHQPGDHRDHARHQAPRPPPGARPRGRARRGRRRRRSPPPAACSSTKTTRCPPATRSTASASTRPSRSAHRARSRPSSHYPWMLTRLGRAAPPRSTSAGVRSR